MYYRIIQLLVFDTIRGFFNKISILNYYIKNLEFEVITKQTVPSSFSILSLAINKKMHT